MHIDRIVLDGTALSWKDAGALRFAIERELASVLAAPGLHHAPWKPSNLARVEAAPVHLSSSPAPRIVGRDVARAIGGAIRS